MAKEPKAIEGDGEHNSYYHLCELNDRVRFQVNGEKPLYLSNRREVRKIATWLRKYLGKRTRSSRQEVQDG